MCFDWRLQKEEFYFNFFHFCIEVLDNLFTSIFSIFFVRHSTIFLFFYYLKIHVFLNARVQIEGHVMKKIVPFNSRFKTEISRY